MINSIYESKNNQCSFVVFTWQFNRDSLDELADIFRRFGYEYQIVPFEKFSHKIKNLGEFHISSYSRLFFSSICDYEKVLYIDLDTLVLGDLYELFKTNIEGYLCAGVQELVYEEQLKALDKETSIYINAGVMLINLAEWRNIDLENKILSYINSRTEPVPLFDQGVINHICDGRIFVLDCKFNVMPQNYRFDDPLLLKKYFNIERYYSKSEFYYSIKSPTIVHFIGSYYGRPWEFLSRHPLRSKYRLIMKSLNLKRSDFPKTVSLLKQRLSVIKRLYLILERILPNSIGRRLNHFLLIIKQYNITRRQ